MLDADDHIHACAYLSRSAVTDGSFGMAATDDSPFTGWGPGAIA